MNSKLYVGNLSFQIDEGKLQDLFAEFGAVKSAKIIMDRDTGRSRGFGFVEMGTTEEAQEAISNLDGKEAEGRRMRVNMAEERTAGGPRGGGRHDRGGERSGGDRGGERGGERGEGRGRRSSFGGSGNRW